jgi:prepilin-type processing-associated H-X9-DG protein
MGCIGCLNPPSKPGEPTPARRFISWNVQLLPNLDQTSLWQRFDLSVPSNVEPNRTAGATVLDVFLCPSTPDKTLVSGGTQWHEQDTDERVSPKGRWAGQAFTDYGGIYGVEGAGRDAPTGARQLLADHSLGVLVYDEAVTPAQVEDGMSRTVAIAEALIRRQSDTEWTNGKNVFAHEGSTPINAWSELGNDVGSPHPGGASVVFCDGHVEFLHDGIDQTAFTQLLTRAGDGGER